jgi:hypothetical protein
MITAAGRNRHAERDQTAVERTKRSEKSAVIVERLVHVQLRAMGCERFDLGIRRDAGEMILREGLPTICQVAHGALGAAGGDWRRWVESNRLSFLSIAIRMRKSRSATLRRARAYG